MAWTTKCLQDSLCEPGSSRQLCRYHSDLPSTKNLPCGCPFKSSPVCHRQPLLMTEHVGHTRAWLFLPEWDSFNQQSFLQSFYLPNSASSHLCIFQALLPLLTHTPQTVHLSLSQCLLPEGPIGTELKTHNDSFGGICPAWSAKRRPTFSFLLFCLFPNILFLVS